MNQTVSLETVRKDVTFKLSAKTKNQKALIKAIDSAQITLVYGMAGTGKTYTAIQKALKMFKDNEIDKIYLIKSVTTLQDEELGFMKGDLREKIEPFAFSFMHAFKKIVGNDVVRKMEHVGAIEFLPIAFLRGVSLGPRTIVLVDEAQNISITSLRTIVTRAEEGCKMVILGDTRQVDLRKKNLSSLRVFIDNFSDFEESEIRFIEFGAEDQMRNKLIIKLEEKFEKLEADNPEMFNRQK